MGVKDTGGGQANNLPGKYEKGRMTKLLDYCVITDMACKIIHNFVIKNTVK